MPTRDASAPDSLVTVLGSEIPHQVPTANQALISTQALLRLYIGTNLNGKNYCFDLNERIYLFTEQLSEELVNIGISMKGS